MYTFCRFNIVFELLERGEVLTVPTDTPLNEKTAWLAFRDVVLGLEYRKYHTSYHYAEQFGSNEIYCYSYRL